MISVFLRSECSKQSVLPEWIIRTLTPRRDGGVAASSWWNQAVGGAKEIVNTLGRRAAAGLSASTGIGLVDNGTGRKIDLAQEQDTQAVREHQASAAAVSTIMALASRFRSVVRNPEEFAADLKGWDLGGC